MKLRKRRIPRSTLTFLFMILSGGIFFITSIFVGTYNNNLTIEIQSMKNEIMNIRTENQQLSTDIQSLQNKDRIYTIAKDSGLTQNQGNVINIKESDNEAK